MQMGSEEMEKGREKNGKEMKIENRAKKVRIKETKIPPLCRKTNGKKKRPNIFILRFYTVSDKEILKCPERQERNGNQSDI